MVWMKQCTSSGPASERFLISKQKINRLHSCRFLTRQTLLHGRLPLVATVKLSEDFLGPFKDFVLKLVYL